MSRQPDAGLTYIEMLVSLALLAIMSVLLAGAFDASRRILDRASGLSLDEDALLARLELRRALENARPDATASPTFAGSANGFTAEFLGQEDAPLNVTYTPEGELQWQGGSADVTQLAKELTGVRFSYYAIDQSSGQRQWTTAWVGENRFPDLIRIEARRPDGSPWPSMVVAPSKRLRQTEISASSPLPPG